MANKKTPKAVADAGLTSRRAMIGALAAAPAMGSPLLASAAAIDPDPIFALIEAAKRARLLQYRRPSTKGAQIHADFLFEPGRVARQRIGYEAFLRMGEHGPE
jgi:hypothetical protein